MAPRSRQGEPPKAETGTTRWLRLAPLRRRAAGSGVSGGTSWRWRLFSRSEKSSKAARSLTLPRTLPRSRPSASRSCSSLGAGTGSSATRNGRSSLWLLLPRRSATQSCLGERLADARRDTWTAVREHKRPKNRRTVPRDERAETSIEKGLADRLNIGEVKTHAARGFQRLKQAGLEHLLLERFERGLDLVVEDRNPQFQRPLR